MSASVFPLPASGASAIESGSGQAAGVVEMGRASAEFVRVVDFRPQPVRNTAARTSAVAGRVRWMDLIFVSSFHEGLRRRWDAGCKSDETMQKNFCIQIAAPVVSWFHKTDGGQIKNIP
jgi:hypothetical protein